MGRETQIFRKGELRFGGSKLKLALGVHGPPRGSQDGRITRTNVMNVVYLPDGARFLLEKECGLLEDFESAQQATSSRSMVLGALWGYLPEEGFYISSL